MYDIRIIEIYITGNQAAPLVYIYIYIWRKLRCVRVTHLPSPLTGSWPSSRMSLGRQRKDHKEHGLKAQNVITRTPNSLAISIAKDISPSAITQVTGRSEFVVKSASKSRKRSSVTDLSETTKSIKSLGTCILRVWSVGRPSEMESKWRVGKWAAERCCRWVRQRWLWSVLRKVTWRPAWHRSSARLRKGLMWPSAGKGKNSICGCSLSMKPEGFFFVKILSILNHNIGEERCGVNLLEMNQLLPKCIFFFF